MKGRHCVAIAAAAAVAAGGPGVAVGQGSGGPPTGTLEFDVKMFGPRYKDRAGVNPAVPRNKNRPKIADMQAAWGQVLMDGKAVGRSHHYEVTTYTPPGRRYRGKGVFHWSDIISFGNGHQLYMECLAEDSPTDNHCAITGGTGRYAGARGSAVVDYDRGREDRRRQTFTVPVVVTFVA